MMTKAVNVLWTGAHGLDVGCSLEFMPGKQVGMSEACYPDSLIGTIPNLYYYAANNPSEATIAKRRSYANTISCELPLTRSYSAGNSQDLVVSLLLRRK